MGKCQYQVHVYISTLYLALFGKALFTISPNKQARNKAMKQHKTGFVHVSSLFGKPAITIERCVKQAVNK